MIWGRWVGGGCGDAVDRLICAPLVSLADRCQQGTTLWWATDTDAGAGERGRRNSNMPMTIPPTSLMPDISSIAGPYPALTGQCPLLSRAGWVTDQRDGDIGEACSILVFLGAYHPRPLLEAIPKGHWASPRSLHTPSFGISTPLANSDSVKALFESALERASLPIRFNHPILRPARSAVCLLSVVMVIRPAAP